MARGGARLGAGRKPHSLSLVVERSTAASILAKINDAKAWMECYKLAKEEGDVRGMVEILKYLTDRRDGRPAQQINVTSLGVTVTAEEIAQARAIVRELRGAAPALPGAPTLDSEAPFC
jgi:hypothetical protein